MTYLPEEIREAIIARINDVSTKHQSFYRSPVEKYDGDPAYVLEYAETDNLWTSSASDQKKFYFNLYVVYDRTDGNGTITAASQELAEKAVSDGIGELYRVVFEKPDVLDLPNGWLRASNVSWGYGGGDDLPYRMALMQLEVTVHQDRS